MFTGVPLQEVVIDRQQEEGVNRRLGLTLCYRSFTDNPLDTDVFVADVSFVKKQTSNALFSDRKRKHSRMRRARKARRPDPASKFTS